MRGVHIKLLILCLVSMLVVSGATAAPKLSDAKIEPATAWIGDHVVMTVTVDDPANEIAKLEAVVVEYPEVAGPLNDQGQGDDKQAGDGIWSGGTDVPDEAFQGTYHIALWPRDAAGKAFKVDDQFVKVTVELTLKPPAPAPAVPTLRDAKIEPASAWIGDHLVLTAAVEDPGKQVAKLEGVVVEYPEIVVPLNDQGQGDDKQAGDGIWSGGSDVPAEAFEGTYHIALWPRDAAGKGFKVDSQFVKATVELTLKPPASGPVVPTLQEPKIEPAAAPPGAHAVLTVAVNDPAKEVAKLEVVVTEYPTMTLLLTDDGQGDDKQAGDGIWSVGIDVPGEAPAGTYHLALWPRNAAGKAFEVNGQSVKATIAFEVKSPEVAPEPSVDALRAAALPWKTEAQIAKIKGIGRQPGEAFRFVVMGDSRTNPEVFAALLKLAAGFPKFGFSMDSGDIVPGGKPEEYAFFFNEIKDVTWPFLVVEGNHELGASGGKLFEELFGPTDYYFDHGGFRFVGLDNSRGIVTPKQLQWLKEALTTELRKIVFFHAPPAVIEKWAWHAFSAGAQELADLLAEKEVERVYVGHIHGFGVADYKGVRYVLSGGAGAGLYERVAPGNFHHIVLVEALPEGLRETVYKADGSSFVLDAEKWIKGEGQ